MAGSKKVIVFDLETIADPAVVDLLPPVTPDSRLKDPVKIEADIEKKKIEQRSSMGLEPATSLIAVFGYRSFPAGDGQIILEDENSEADLLKKAWDLLCQHDHFVTFNGRSFDVPTLLMHGLKNRIRPTVNIDLKRYVMGNHTDVRMALTNWDSFKKGSSLDFYSRMLLGRPAKDGMDGSQVQDFWDMGLKDDIAAYCKSDVEITAEMFDLVTKYYL